EIVQLYVSPVDTTSTMKPIQLKGFERVALKSGESKTLVFKISPQQLVQYENGLLKLENMNLKLVLLVQTFVKKELLISKEMIWF
ncbi:fibronectin type III-like domain-contianing protein, partial [Flavobacterium sp.]|uniref:fibronectin type III-like domain-contianing protein n=1 Tax=Flavobacterium sp. TaxID=239 RepID=UPI003C4E1553